MYVNVTNSNRLFLPQFCFSWVLFRDEFQCVDKVFHQKSRGQSEFRNY